MSSIIDYIKESYDELVNKVTWPSWGSLINTSRVVLVATAIITLIIFALDVISEQALGMIYPN